VDRLIAVADRWLLIYRDEIAMMKSVSARPLRAFAGATAGMDTYSINLE